MNNNFLWNLRNIRNERGMSQKDLADLLGVTKQTIFTYEKGTSFPSLETLKKMPNVLNVTVEELFGFTALGHLKELQKVIQEKIKITAEAETVEHDETITKAILNEQEEMKQKFIDDISLDKMSLNELSEIRDYIYKKKINEILAVIEKDEKDSYKDLLSTKLKNNK